MDLLGKIETIVNHTFIATVFLVPRPVENLLFVRLQLAASSVNCREIILAFLAYCFKIILAIVKKAVFSASLLLRSCPCAMYAAWQRAHKSVLGRWMTISGQESYQSCLKEVRLTAGLLAFLQASWYLANTFAFVSLLGRSFTIFLW